MKDEQGGIITGFKMDNDLLTKTQDDGILYGALFRNNHVAMLLVDPDTGNIIDANPAACSFYLYNTETLLKMKIYDISVSSKEDVFEKMGRAKRQSGNCFYTAHRLGNGEVRDVEAYTSPVLIKDRTLLFCVIHDITERRKAEDRLGESEKSLSAILSVSPIGICRLKNKVFEWVNEAMCKMTGYSFEEFVGKEPRFLFENDAAFKRAISIDNADKLCETQHVKKDGCIIEVLLQASRIDSAIVIVAVTDITDRKNSELEQAKMGKLESLGVLAGGIAHDFNNILTMILGNVSLAKMYMTKDLDKSREKLLGAEQAITRAKDLTQRFLTFSKGGAPVKRVVAIGDFLEEVCQFALTGTSAICEFDFAPDLLPVEIDEGQMTQAIGHIIINGSQAMPEGGKIFIKAQNVTVDVPTDNIPAGTYVRISIVDQGEGISEECLSKIFDPYFTTKQKGSGLGLAVCYSIVKNHKGYVKVESTLSVGTTFQIYLRAFESPVYSETDDSGGTFSATGEGRVLVMDDEEYIRDILGDILSMQGYTVDFAKNGVEAIELYRDNSYDVVILDLTVPGGMGGKETMRALLDMDPNVKVIVSSGYSSDPIMSNYKQYGFRDVIGKPYRIEELGEMIERVIAEN
jgi:PAS domain S-box-containing protein